jgi:hypothetical protein
MKITEERLGAYLDGELDAAERAEIAAAMAQDPEIVQRLDRMRGVHNKLLAAYSGIANEPVPQRLTDALRGEARVAALAKAKSDRNRFKLRWTAPELSALAASVVVGVALGYFLLKWAGAGIATPREGQLLVRGAVAEALSSQLASAQARDTPVRIGLTFRDRFNDYCRSFALRGRSNLAGLACRENGGWRVHALAQINLPSGGNAEPAGTELPREILQAVQERIVGEPLDASGEAAARRLNWSAR